MPPMFWPRLSPLRCRLLSNNTNSQHRTGVCCDQFELEELIFTLARDYLRKLANIDEPPKPAKAPRGQKKIRFTRSFEGGHTGGMTSMPGYAEGETGAFAPDVARQLIDGGYAVQDDAA
jgi:hypothetical protein